MADESAQQDTTAAGAGENTDQATTEQPQGGEQKPVDGQGEQQASGNEGEHVELKAPEGLDESAFQKLSEQANELGLEGEQAQKFIDSHAEAKKQFTESADAQWKEMTDGWLEQVKADEEIGGDNFETSVQLADKALTQFSTPEFKKALNESGYGNHPEMVRVFARMGKFLSEDKPVGGEDNQGGEKSREQTLYPNLAQ